MNGLTIGGGSGGGGGNNNSSNSRVNSLVESETSVMYAGAGDSEKAVPSVSVK